MAVETSTSGAVTATGLSGRELVAAAQRMARSYTQARQSLPQLPASYQSARPWFIVLGRMVSQTNISISAEAR